MPARRGFGLLLQEASRAFHPGVRTVDIPTSSGDEEPYFYVEDAVGLVSEAQMDTLEFHLWAAGWTRSNSPT